MKLLAGLLVAVTVVFGSFVGVWKLGSSEEVTYRTAEIQRGDLMIAVSATGTVEPEEVVDVGAQVVGRIKSFGVDPFDPEKTIDYGTLVEEGTVLAQIDEATYAVQVSHAEADLMRTKAEMVRYQANMERAKADWQRARELEDSIPRCEYDKFHAGHEMAKADLKIGEARILQAEASLEQAEVNLGYVTIKSPINGVVLDRRVNVGQTVVAGLNAPSLFLLAKDLGQLEIWASVNEADMGQIRLEQDAEFTVDAYPTRAFRGKVTQIRLNASMTQNVVTYTVIVAVDNPDRKLLPYMTANLKFEVVRRSNALLVANQALRWWPAPQLIVPEAEQKVSDNPPGAGNDGNRGTLWIEAGGGLVRPVIVRVGLSDGVMSELVEADLEPGAKVVVGQAYDEEDPANFTSIYTGIKPR